MAVGEVFPSEATTYGDPESGATIHRLTDALAHSGHLYFTHPGWFDGGRRLLVFSDRGGARNFYSIDLAGDRSMTQITDLARGELARSAAVNPARDEAYSWIRGELFFAEPRSSIAHHGHCQQCTHENQRVAPDEILVLEDIETSGRGDPQQVSDEDHQNDRPRTF